MSGKWHFLYACIQAFSEALYVHSSYSGLSDDGTGSSNSIYDPTAAINGELEPHIPYAPEVIPEESSGKKYLRAFSLSVNLSNILLAFLSLSLSFSPLYKSFFIFSPLLTLTYFNLYCRPFQENLNLNAAVSYAVIFEITY